MLRANKTAEKKSAPSRRSVSHFQPKQLSLLFSSLLPKCTGALLLVRLLMACDEGEVLKRRSPGSLLWVTEDVVRCLDQLKLLGCLLCLLQVLIWNQRFMREEGQKFIHTLNKIKFELYFLCFTNIPL